MNREILFRGKRKENDEWIEGNGINQQIDVAGNKHIYIALPIKSRAYPPMTTVEWTEVIPETVGQYTGLTDKNSKKIFEGDIAKHTQQYDISWGVVSIGIVKWSNSYGSWVITDFDNGRADMFLGNEAHRTEVIGNIHNNPELLEAAE